MGGRAGSALRFINNPAQWVSAANCITVADDPELRPTNALTISAWFKAANANGRHVIAKEYGSGLHE